MLRGIFKTKNLDDILASAQEKGHTLKRTLGPINITLLGIGAIIGAGIFATVGTAAAGDASRPGAGPSLMVSFGITAIVCAFTALCYAEMAAMVPISGSAYTYSYATLGELVAWIIGWDLILEYAIGNVAVAISWANYFRSFVDGIFGLLGSNKHVPLWLATDYRTAATLAKTDPVSYAAKFGDAPHIFGHAIIINFFAFGIVALITIVLVWGIKESAEFNAGMVMIKIVVLLFFVGMALYYVSPSKMESNWHPFQPNHWGGTLAAAAVVFFAYIGFDAVSTVAEECKNPARDLPIGIIASLAICTVFYVVVAAVFTGIMPYSELVQRLTSEQAEPLTMALTSVSPKGVIWPSTIVAFGSVVAHTAVLLVFQLGQPRIFFSIARDGLLPPVFAKVHPRFKTPHVTTILTGVVVGLFAAVMSIDEMVDLTNIGTLFAFVLVCVGIIILRYKDPGRHRPFRVPSSLWWYGLLAAVIGLVLYFLPQLLGPQFTLVDHLFSLPAFMMSGAWRYIEPPLFAVAALALVFIYPRTGVGKRLPLGAWALPLLGAGSCIFLMYYLPPTSWWRFVAWLMIGLAVYLSYSYSRSHIGRQLGRPESTPLWLGLVGLGSFLIAIGLLTVPHEAGLKSLFDKLLSDYAVLLRQPGGPRIMVGFACIGLGLVFAAIGSIVGFARRKSAG
jgi:APA family basic amino acid/polyamine antiporter